MRARSLESPGKRAQAYRRIYVVASVLRFLALLVLGTGFATAAATLAYAQAEVRVASPAGRNEATALIHDGRLYYSLRPDRRAVLLPSPLGFGFQPAPPLPAGLRAVVTLRQTV